MILFIRLIGFPLLVALLTWVLLELIQMNSKEKIGHLLKAFAVVAALIVGLMNSTNTLCEKREAKATEIVELIPKISHAVNYETGVGDVCETFDGEPYYTSDEDIIRARESLRADDYLLSFKLVSLPMSKKVAAASKNYGNAIRDIKKYCKTTEGFQPKELENKKSVVNDTSWKLIQALGVSVAKCY